MNNASPSNGANDRWRGAFALVSLCFLLSGFAALLYETVWLRQFAIILGTSEQALAVILASYMGGLSAGAWVASKRIDNVRRPVWMYGVLEAGIAICALAMPWGLSLVESLQVQLFGGAAEPPAAGSFSQIMFGLTSSAVLILPPTAMMGATLPLLAKQVVHRDQDIGPRIGVLYGINTFGAVAGTLAAAFWLLPSLGLGRTTWVGAAINFGIFLLVFVLVRSGSLATGAPVVESDDVAESDGIAESQQETTLEESQSPDPVAESEVSEDDSRYRLVLWFAAAAGAIAFCYEIIFTRMLGHILGGSIYAFATMLAGFLLGIALGGMIASRLAIRRNIAVVSLIYAQALAGVSSLLAYYMINMVAGWSLDEWGGRSAMLSQVGVSILILMPTATFMGATFPLATRIFARDESEAASGSARVYFFNTIGGITGALCTGIFLLPALAYQNATFFAILFNASLALALVWVMRTRLVHFTAGAIAILMLLCFRPGVPERLMRVSALNPKPTEGKLIFTRVGRSGTVALFDQLGDVRFMTNGLPEAIVARVDTVNPFAASGAWLSVLPPLLRDDCDSMLIIGLGGGVAAAHAPPSVEQIDIFELEPAVVEANRFVGVRRAKDPLSDPRINIILNDGRNGLALTSKKYDAIVSQPSHPWTAGASHLFTREFAETARERLQPGGIFLQWMNSGFVNPDLLSSLSATLLDVFPHVRVYEPTPQNVLFVASDEPIEPEATSEPILELDPRDQDFYTQFGIQTPTHLFSLLRLDEQSLRKIAEGADVISDEENLLAMRSPFLLASKDEQEMKDFLDRHAAYNLPPTQVRKLCPTLNPRVLGLRLLSYEGTFGESQVRALSADPSEAILYEALAAKKAGQTERWAELLRAMATEFPDDPRPALLLLAYRQLGTPTGIDEPTAEDLRTHLDDRHAELLAAIEAVSRNDLASVAQREPQLASFGTDEVAYPLAVRMQLIWRISDTGLYRKQNNRDALDVIARAVPVMGVDALITFRVAAALGSEQPKLALATVVGYAKGVVGRLKQKSVKDQSTRLSLRTNLERCRQMVDHRESFRLVAKADYVEAIEYLDKVIAGDIEL